MYVPHWKFYSALLIGLLWLCLTLFTMENLHQSQMTKACRLLKEALLLMFAASEELCPPHTHSLFICMSHTERMWSIKLVLLKLVGAFPLT